MGLSVKIGGIDRLVAAFIKIPRIAQKNMRVALREGLHLVESESRSPANHRYKSHTGHADSAYKTTVSPDGMVGTLALDPTKKAPYINILHDGSKPHKIYPRNKAALAFTMGGKKVIIPRNMGYVETRAYWHDQQKLHGFTLGYKGYVNHPGTDPDFFIERALETKTSECVGLVQSAMAATIKEAGF
jgi:hypothetical protein